MAILKDIKVAIKINGRELKEYDDEDVGNDDENSVSKYVEATSDAEFKIISSAPRRYQFTSDAVQMDIFMDGAYVDNWLILKEDSSRFHAWRCSLYGPRRSVGNRWEIKPFKFREITSVENDFQRPNDITTSAQIKDLGTIHIEVHRCNMVGKGRTESPEFDKNLGGASVVTEKQLKGKSVTHGVALGDARKIIDVMTYDSVYVDEKDSPVAKFTFKYCSRKALQDLLLIPRTPSPPREPTPLPLEERNIEDLTFEEMRELLRRQHARYRTEPDSIKNETGVKREGTKAERGIKRERDDEYDELIRSAVTKKVKSRSFEHGETIELD